MKPGFYLKCGMHWTHVTEGYGCIWTGTADERHATRFDTLAEAEAMKARLESRWRAPKETIVEIPAVPVRLVPRIGVARIGNGLYVRTGTRSL